MNHTQDMSAADVSRFLADFVTPLQATETVELQQALGRVLAREVVSPISVPPHDNSAMDGFAFHGAALAGADGLSLRVVGTALAGKAWDTSVGPGECLKIMTGAVLPASLDTVVPVELTRREGDQVLFTASAVAPGDNRRPMGEDLMAGQPALHAGHRLNAASLGLLASLGLARVEVFRRLRVAYFSTGNEILSLGEAPREGAVYDSNRFSITGLLERLGVHMIDLGVVRDNAEAMEAAFREAADRADAIITSGGVSMGDADHTRAILKRLGDVAFWRIAMRPGRPMAVGRVGNGPSSAVLFGLPGNPVAVMVTFLAFVRPALLRMMGATAEMPVLLKARSLEPLRKKPGRTEYQRGTVSLDPEGHLVVRTTGNQGSGVLRSMVEANGLIVLPHDQGDVAAGDEVKVMMLDAVI